ncbi:hypothetical protein OJF2_53200 [Aquisphaera giovannonii]|uniref:Uncharacterized protein n=1 Tax=Aquisphaera giovannonii TaxID=406548 RepID=A0A5B9W9H2_9BACT|nr:hypothetical protein [Aquisphaera giovannonii]QEH36735.1 hypothetical protein OJF2_53200 [Aquisphaera giovannonii]
MSRRFLTAGAMVVALLAINEPARAQWGYPGGYGGWGWGGWGASTAQGDIARGLGMYAMGAGVYNQQTAVANSINTDTVMRWNQYVYESQKEANRLHQAKLASDRERAVTGQTAIRDRLRNKPEQADIYRGDALNVAAEEINDPRVYTKALQGAGEKIGGQMIRQIPFQYATGAICVSIHQLTKGGPPAPLLRPEFEEDRETIKALGQAVRKQIEEDKTPDDATIDKLLTAINNAEAKADKIFPANSREDVEADRYLKALHGLVAMLRTPALDVIMADVADRPDATLGQLLNFMNAFNLRFGPAGTPEQRMVYDALYPKLVALRDQVAPALASAATVSPSGSAPHEFFNPMSYDDLKKKAPAPPQPAQP